MGSFEGAVSMRPGVDDANAQGACRVTTVKCFSRMIAWLGLMFLLAACGGSGGASAGSGDAPLAPPTETFLFHAGSLVAVDPANATQTTVEAGTVTGVAGVLHGTYDPATREVRDLHQRSIVYAHGGRLYKVHAVKSGAHPTAVPLSSESSAHIICETRTFANLADHDNAFYFYRLPGADGSCGTADDQLKVARLGMGVTDTPIGVGTFKVIAAVLDMANGGLDGWLFLHNNGTALWHSNLHVSSSTLIDVGIGLSDVEFTAYATDGRVFLRVVQTGFDRLRLYNPSTRLMSSGYHFFSASGTARLAVDDRHLYLQDGAKIHRLPLDGSVSSTPLHDAGSNAITGLALTSGRVVWVTRDASNVYRLHSLPKTGTALVAVLETSAANQDIFIVGTTHNRIYYNLGLFSGDDAAGMVVEGGNVKSVQPNAAWTAIVNGNRAALGEVARLGRFAGTPSHVLLTNLGALPRRVSVYDAAPNQLLSVSTLPGATAGFLGAGLASAGAFLGQSGIGGGSDIYYLKLAQDESLIPLTNTPGTEERVVGGCMLAAGSRGDSIDPMLPVLLFTAVVVLVLRRGQHPARTA